MLAGKNACPEHTPPSDTGKALLGEDGSARTFLETMCEILTQLKGLLKGLD